MRKASNAAQDAAAEARGHGSEAAMMKAADAVPGAPSESYLLQLGQSWDEEIAAWVSAVGDFGDDLAATGEDYRQVDDQSFGFFGGLLAGTP